MAVAKLEQLREPTGDVARESNVIPLTSTDLLLPDSKSLRLEGNTWVIRDEDEMVALGGDTEGALMATYGITKGRRIENAWRALQNIPIESLDTFKSPTFGDLYSDLSEDQLKLADIVLELEILNEAGNPDDYTPDQVLVSIDDSAPPIFRVDHAISASEGLSIFFRKVERENGEPEYIKLGACSKDKRDQAVDLFGKFGYQPEKKSATEVDFVESMIAEIATISSEAQPQDQDTAIEEVEQIDDGGIILDIESARVRLRRAEQVWPVPILRKVPRVQIDPLTLKTPGGITVSPFIAHLLGVALPEDKEDSPVAGGTHTVFSRDSRRPARPLTVQIPEKTGKDSHGHEAHSGETIRVTKGTFPWINQDVDVPVVTIQIGQRKIRLVDVSETDNGFLTVSKGRLNGGTPKAVSLAKSTIGEAVTNHGIVKGARAITSAAQGLPGPIIQRNSNEPNERSRVTVHVTLPRANSDLAYFVAGGPFGDALKSERTLAGYVERA